jgi:hypothetical protein
VLISHRPSIRRHAKRVGQDLGKGDLIAHGAGTVLTLGIDPGADALHECVNLQSPLLLLGEKFTLGSLNPPAHATPVPANRLGKELLAIAAQGGQIDLPDAHRPEAPILIIAQVLRRVR